MLDKISQQILTEYENNENKNLNELLEELNEIKSQSYICTSYKLTRTLNYIKTTFIRSVLVIYSITKLIDEKLELRVNTEYLTEGNFEEINFTYAQFSFIYQDQILLTGIVTLYTNFLTSLQELLDQHENKGKYIRKFEKMMQFEDVVYIDDFVKLIQLFSTKIKLIQKNYALVDNYLIQTLMDKLFLNHFYLESTNTKYEKGLIAEVLKDGCLFRVSDRNIKLKIRKDKMKFSFSKIIINKKYEIENLEIKVGKNVVDVNKFVSIPISKLVYFKMKNKDRCLALSKNLRKLLLVHLKVKSTFKNKQLRTTVLINKENKSKFKIMGKKCNVNNIFNHEYFKNLSYVILYMIKLKYFHLPTKIRKFEIQY